MNPFPSLAAAYAWLDAHVNFEQRLPTIRHDEAEFGLEAFRMRLAAIGNPHLGLRTVHVAGTRGKGSAALALEALLRASGCRVATFTSPHLREYRERIRLDGEPIGGDEFRRLLETIAALPSAGRDDGPTGFRTVFENLTALFFLTAHETGVDWAVVETGLGGRLDATNVLAPGPVLLTRIGLDHTYLLGDTHGAIAAEKAAILKPGGWCVAGTQADGAAGEAVAAVFEGRARETGAPLDRAAVLCPLVESTLHPAGQSLTFRFEGELLRLDLPLLGTFVAENLQNALAVMARLRALGAVPAVPHDRLVRALQWLRFAGRMQRIAHDPDLIVDGAHCPTGATALAASMQAHFADQPADLILGMMRDKDHRAFLAALATWPHWRRVYCYAPHGPRALDAERLAEAARDFFPQATPCSNLQDALHLWSAAGDKSIRAVATGTLYSVADSQDWATGRAPGHGVVEATAPNEPRTGPGDSGT